MTDTIAVEIVQDVQKETYEALGKVVPEPVKVDVAPTEEPEIVPPSIKEEEKVEAKTETQPEKVEEKPEVSSATQRWLLKQERQIREEKQELARKEQELQTKYANMPDPNTIIQRFVEDPINAYRQAGVQGNPLDHILSKSLGVPIEPKPVDRIKALEDERAAEKQERQKQTIEWEKQRTQQQREKLQNDTIRYVSEFKDTDGSTKYELINTLNGHNLALEVTQRLLVDKFGDRPYTSEDYVSTVDKAAAWTENYLIQQTEKLKETKVGKRLFSQTPSYQPITSKQPTSSGEKEKQPTVTAVLHNNITSGSDVSETNAFEHLSIDEINAKAIKEINALQARNKQITR